MAKDPRFNFYPDNWDGGTEDFTLEQEGAYLRLIIMHSRKGRFTAEQAIDTLMRKTRGNTAVSTGLWNFLIPKFETDGKVYWSERLEKELEKSRIHSEKQSDRIKKRWSKESGNTTVYTNEQVLPVNGSGNRIETDLRKEVQEETIDARLDTAFNDLYLEPLSMKAPTLYPGVDFTRELERFRLKVKGSPRVYADRNSEGLRAAFEFQLRSMSSASSPAARLNGRNQPRPKAFNLSEI